MTLNIVMIVKNEAKCLARCLNSVQNLADEIIVIDTGSTDGTKQIALEFGAVIYDYEWNRDFSAARNFSLSKSGADWNLVLDADEYLAEGDRKSIGEFMQNQNRIGAILRKDIYEADGEVSLITSRISRLLPKGCCYKGKIHEQVDSLLPRIAIPLVFDHDGYLREGKGERNLPLLMEEIQANPTEPYYLYQAAATLHHLKRFQEAAVYFHDFYSLAPPDANYRSDGIVLYLYTLSELGQMESILTLINKEQRHLSEFSDFMFFCGIFYTKLVLSDVEKYISYLPQIEQSYQRCIEIGERQGTSCVHGTGSFKAFHNLGAWYEASGNRQQALTYYQKAAASDYQPSIDRLEKLR